VYTAEYKHYITSFVWQDLKYSTKKSLAELTALITKVGWLENDLSRKCAPETSRSRSRSKT
jgi:hypothetical protein